MFIDVENMQPFHCLVCKVCKIHNMALYLSLVDVDVYVVSGDEAREARLDRQDFSNNTHEQHEPVINDHVS